MAPEEVRNAPVLQNVLRGNSVDILTFPAPHWHENDGGRYIGTFDAVISRDPEGGYVNVGTYRVQVHDERTVGLWIIPGKHGNLIAQKYWSKGEDCPFLTLTPEQRAANDMVSSCMIVDACRPYGRKDHFPAVSSVSAEYRQTVLKRWAHLFGGKA